MQPMPADILEYSRDLRRRMTDAECLLWRVLRDRRLGGFKFRRQKAFGRYIVDFYCSQRRLAIELDGGGHADTRQQRYDEARTAALNAEGVLVLRFWNNEVVKETDAVLQQIWTALHEHTAPSPCPSPASGRGDHLRDT